MTDTSDSDETTIDLSEKFKTMVEEGMRNGMGADEESYSRSM